MEKGVYITCKGLRDPEILARYKEAKAAHEQGKRLPLPNVKRKATPEEIDQMIPDHIIDALAKQIAQDIAERRFPFEEESNHDNK